MPHRWATGLDINGAIESPWSSVPLQVLMDRWDPAVAARVIREEKCNFTFAATRFLQDLLEEARKPDEPPFELRLFVSGGAPIPRVFVQQARDRMNCQLFAAYGQTECFVATTTSNKDSVEKIANTDGCQIPGVEVRIAGPDGNELHATSLGS